MSDYQIQTLGNTTFVLRPEYDALVLEFGGEPPMGVPVECTFDWAWDVAEQKIAKQNRLAAVKAQAQARRERAAAAKAEATPRKTPARKAPARKTAAKPAK